jgi:hypothetical protein
MLIHFDSPAGAVPPTLQGWQTLAQEIVLVDRDNFTANASSQFLDSAGSVYRTGCATAVGRRIG